MKRAVSCAIVALLGLIACRVEATPSAMDAGPTGPIAKLYVRDLAPLYQEIEEIRALLRFFGLGDEGFSMLSELSRTHLGIDVLDASAVAKAGVDLSRGAAFYFWADPEPQACVIFGASDAGTLTKSVTGWLERAEGQRRKANKSSQHGGTFVTLQGSDGLQPDLALFVRDGLAHFGPATSLGYVGAGAASTGGGSAPSGSHVEFGMWLDAETAANVVPDPEIHEISGIVRSFSLRVWSSAEGLHIDGEAAAGPHIKGLLGKMTPSYRDAARQTALFREQGAPPAFAARVFFPLRGLFDWLREQGELGDEDLAEFKAELGLDLEQDIVDVLLGDFTIIAPTGLADCRIEASVSEPGKAKKVLLSLLGDISKPGGAPAKGAPGPPPLLRTLELERDQYVTEVHIEDIEDWFLPRIFWTFRGGRLLVGLAPTALEDVKRPSAAAIEWTTAPGVRRQLERPSLVYVYGSGSDIYASLQDLIAVVRQMFGPNLAAIMDIFDVPMLVAAMTLSAEQMVDLDQDGIRLQGSSTLLTLNPAAPAGSAPGDFAAALKLLYAGRVQDARRHMHAVAERYPDTPEGRRADGYAFGHSSVLLLYAFLGPAVAGSLMYRAMAESPAYDTEAVLPVEPPPPADPCLAWAELACLYKGDASKECKRAETYRNRKNGKFSEKERKQCALDLYEMRGY